MSDSLASSPAGAPAGAPTGAPTTALPFVPGDLVLAKFDMYGFHPAVVLANIHVPKHIIEELSSFETPGVVHYYVLFTGDHSYGLCHHHQLRHLTKEKAHDLKRDKRYRGKERQLALTEASEYSDYWKLLIQADLVHSDEERYTLTSILDAPPHTRPPPPNSLLPQNTGLKRPLTADLQSSPGISIPLHSSLGLTPPPKKQRTSSPEALATTTPTYRPGQLVLAQFAHYPWWCAVVVANCHVSKQNYRDLQKYKRAGEEYCYVLFFHDNTLGSCNIKYDLRPITTDEAKKEFALLRHRKGRPTFRTLAYGLAAEYKSYWELLVERQMVPANQTPYELETIHDTPPAFTRKDSSPNQEVLMETQQPDQDVDDSDDGNAFASASPEPQPQTHEPESPPSPFPYSPGALVMARFSAFPWLPAVVMANYHVPQRWKDELESFGMDDELCGYVMFLGDGTFGICPSDDLKPLTRSECEEMVQRPLNEIRLKGYLAASKYSNYWSLLVDSELVGKNKQPYTLKNIDSIPPKPHKKITRLYSPTPTETSDGPYSTSASPSVSSTPTPAEPNNKSTKLQTLLALKKEHISIPIPISSNPDSSMQSSTSRPLSSSPLPTSNLKSFPVIPGGIVRARFAGFPWWPAVVMANCHVPPHTINELSAYKKPGVRYCYIMFVDDRNYGVCRASCIMPMSKEKAIQLRSKETSTKRKSAYTEAMKYEGKYWDFLIDCGIVNKNDSQYHLKSIYTSAPYPPAFALNPVQKRARSVSESPSIPALKGLTPKGRSALENATPNAFPYRPGDLVMAHFLDSPRWPAVVIADCHVPEKNIVELEEFIRSDDPFCYVIFLGDHSIKACNPSALEPLSKERAVGMKNWTKKGKGMMDAIHEAADSYTDYWDLLLECGFVDKDETRYELKSIHDLPPDGAMDETKRKSYEEKISRGSLAQKFTSKDPFPFAPGDLVLCPFEAHMSWPAIVLANCHVSVSDRLELAVDLQPDILYGYIIFMGAREVALCSANELIALDSVKAAKMGKWKKGRTLEAAMEDAFKYAGRYWDLLIELNVVTKDQPPSVFKTILDLPSGRKESKALQIAPDTVVELTDSIESDLVPSGTTQTASKHIEKIVEAIPTATQNAQADHSSFPYSPGDLVLSHRNGDKKFGWPSIVMADCHISEETRKDLKSARKKTDLPFCYILRLGLPQFAMAYVDELKPLSRERARKMTTWKQSRNLTDASLQAANFSSYWELIVNMKIVEKTAVKYDLKSIHDLPPSPTRPSESNGDQKKQKKKNNDDVVLKSTGIPPSSSLSADNSVSKTNPKLMSYPSNKKVTTSSRTPQPISTKKSSKPVPPSSSHSHSKTHKLSSKRTPKTTGRPRKPSSSSSSSSRPYIPSFFMPPVRTTFVSKKSRTESKPKPPSTPSTPNPQPVVIDEPYLSSPSPELIPLSSDDELEVPEIVDPRRQNNSVIPSQPYPKPNVSPYKPGDLVMARFSNLPFYPAIVIADIHVPRWNFNALNRHIIPGVENVFILFTGDRIFGVVQLDRLIPFSRQDAHERSQEIGLDDFQRNAYLDAAHYTTYWNILRESKLVAPTEIEYHLESIHDNPKAPYNVVTDHSPSQWGPTSY